MLPFNSEASVFTGARTRACTWINLVFLPSTFSLFQWLFHYFLVGKLIKYLQLKKFRARKIHPTLSGNTAIRALCWEVKYFHQNAIRYGRDINWVPAEHPVNSAAVLCGRSGHFSMYFCKGFRLLLAHLRDSTLEVWSVNPTVIEMQQRQRAVLLKVLLFILSSRKGGISELCWVFGCYKFSWFNPVQAGTSCWARGGAVEMFSLILCCNVPGTILLSGQKGDSMHSQWPKDSALNIPL